MPHLPPLLVLLLLLLLHTRSGDGITLRPTQLTAVKVVKKDAAAPPATTTTTLYSRIHYLQCALAGALSCSTTHALMVPLDVIKTHIQTDVAKGQKTIPAAFKSVVSNGGVQALLQGFTATYSGYFVQGAAKFGFYEYFKHKLSAALINTGYQVPTLPVCIASSGLAEVIASVALTPMEVTKIDMMTNPRGNTRGMLSVMAAIVRQGGPRALFRGLPLIMLRQVPYTCVKLAGYDYIVDTLRRNFAPEEAVGGVSGYGGENAGAGSGKGQCKKMNGNGVKVGVGKKKKAGPRRDLQLLSGVLAGLLAATISHPADVMLSKVCVSSKALTQCIILQTPADLIHLLREIGFRGCFKGLEVRALITALTTMSQFAIYEEAKSQLKQLYV